MKFNDIQIDPIEQLRLLDRVDCEDSLYLFLKSAWKYIDTSTWQDGWAIQAVAEHLEAVCDGSIRKLCINIPPRHSKSSLVSVAYPAWTWAQRNKGHTSGPNVRFLVASYAQQLVLRDSVRCRRLIESPWYQKLWGSEFSLTGDQNTKSRFSNDKGGERLITSVGAAVTGEGGDCLSGSTLVSTPQGPKPIRDIGVGEYVYGFDVVSEKVVKRRVLAFRRIPSRGLCELHTSSGNSIRCTPDHLIFDQKVGYRAASEMGKGDRITLLRTGGDMHPEKHPTSEMQPVQRERRSNAVCRAEASKEGWQDDVLFGEMPIRAQRDIQSSPMSGMWKAHAVAVGQVLLRCMQAYAYLRKAQKEILSAVRDYLRRMDDVLLSVMRGCSALGKYARFLELKLFPHGPIWQSVPGNAPSHHREGWGGMYGMPSSGKEEYSDRREGEVESDGPSYGREHAQQFSRKSDLPMSELSQEAPSWDVGYVTSVSSDCEQEEWVYDIQVEGCHNFFANGVLVHNCIIIDDPNAAQEAFSEASIMSTIEWWDGAMSTRLNDARLGAYVLIQQRLSEMDLTGHIQEKQSDGWDFLVLPAEYEPDRKCYTSIGWEDPRTKEGELLWPERFGPDEMKGYKSILGPFGFAGQMQQRPEPAGGGIIKREYWQPWDSAEYPPMDYILATVDTAYTEKTENDPSAMTIWGVFSEDVTGSVNRILDAEGRPMYAERASYLHAPKVMLMYAWTERLEFHQLVEKVAITAKRLKVDKLIIEAKASGISVAQEIRRLYSHEGFGVQLVNPGALDKVARLHSVQHIFADLIVHAPNKEWAETTITQVAQFPKGRHDDLVDCTSMAIRHLRDIGMLTRSPERQADLDESLRFRGNEGKQALYPT